MFTLEIVLCGYNATSLSQPRTSPPKGGAAPVRGRRAALAVRCPPAAQAHYGLRYALRGRPSKPGGAALAERALEVVHLLLTT